MDFICEECEDRLACVSCDDCEGAMCDLCFHSLHRKGRRALHKPRKLGKASKLRASDPDILLQDSAALYDHSSCLERAKYIPLRLSMDERRYLRLLESALTVSDYTGQVDVHFPKAAKRNNCQLSHIAAMLAGLITAIDYNKGQEMLESMDFIQHEGFYQDIFEIARRHKIMNPEKMRSEYGKMIYLMQDACSVGVKKELDVQVYREIKSVHSLLKQHGGLKMLSDPGIELATREILPDPTKTRGQIQQMIRRKEKMVEQLKRKYSSPTLSVEDIHLCLYSMCDNDSFLNSNRVPIDKMIALLQQYFKPTSFEEGYNLAIIAGEDGARLTHSHERQYYFALQSLTLWREIVNDMFRLWCLAESDLLNEAHPYTLTDTGQGLQRVQNSPLTFKAMQEVLYNTQRSVKTWVGSSVIHLGDKNVPNSLLFVDKYTQVSRILTPVVSCIEQLNKLVEDNQHGIASYIDESFGGAEKLSKDILLDFFRCAFDGSGADNFYDAGSCIDGRLTSAWNWCSSLSEKPFYPIFKLTGQVVPSVISPQPSVFPFTAGSYPECSCLCPRNPSTSTFVISQCPFALCAAGL
ncbi:unnamed protein product [Chrysoparadoxa australica]